VKLTPAELYDGKTIRYFPHEKDKIGEGAEKVFFRTENNRLIIGFYKNQNTQTNRARLRQLIKIVEKFKPDTGNEQHFCWPVSVVVSPRLGIVTPQLPSRFYFKTSKGEKKSAWFLTPRLIRKLPPEERGVWLDKFQICRHLCRSFGKLHAAGLAHSDLSGNNILMDPLTGTSMLLDTDSLVVPGILPPRVLGTDKYMAPEIVATHQLPVHHPRKCLPCIRTDLHSLAVLIYQTLLLRHPLIGKKIHSEDDPEKDDILMLGEKALFIENPHDISNRPEHISVPVDAVGPYLKPLFDRAFIDGLHTPEQRPTALEWEEALTATLDILYPCDNLKCLQKWYVCREDRPTQCPFCGHPGTSTVPIMRFFRKYKNGQYISEGKNFVIFHNKKIYPWHTRTNIRYPNVITATSRHEGKFIFKNDQWRFKNADTGNRFTSSGKIIRPGGSFEIENQGALLLDSHANGRLGFFKVLTFTAPSNNKERI